jgi:hypothetical protein
VCRFGDFPEVEELLHKEKQLRHMRRCGNIAEILGEMHLKVDSLNMQCFVLTFAGSPGASKIIMDLEMLPSLPLSRAASPQALVLEDASPIPEVMASAFELNDEVSACAVDHKFESNLPDEVAGSQLSLQDPHEDTLMNELSEASEQVHQPFKLIKLRLMELLHEDQE